MTINFKNAFDIHPAALRVREKRAELLASNLANVDTPHYKARDIDFRAILKGEQTRHLDLSTTQTSHQLHRVTDPLTGETLYRNPYQASLDGNTVESEQEHLQFAENALRYQATLGFLSGEIATLRSAIRGD